MSDKHKYII